MTFLSQNFCHNNAFLIMILTLYLQYVMILTLLTQFQIVP